MARRQHYQHQYDGKEHFPQALTFSIKGDESTDTDSKGLSTSMIGAEDTTIRELVFATINDCREKGFDDNAIVCLKPKNLSENWRRMSHMQWGIVVNLDRYPPKDGVNKWAPICVRWIVPAAHSGKQTEHFFPDELYLIHGALSSTLMSQIFEAQDE